MRNRLLAILVVGIAPFTLADDTRPKNVLFIAIDDLRPELGCYGVPYAQTPHLDRFAESGVVFRNHFVQVPTCGASRYALLTGRSPARSGVTRGNHSFYGGPSALVRGPTAGAQSLPELFRRSGYRTVAIGKISHTADGKVYAYNGGGDGRPEMPNAWDALPTPYGAWKRGWGVFFAYEGGRHREDGGGNKDLLEFTAKADDELPDGQIAERAVEQLRDLSSRAEPFFLAVGFFKPHLPFVATAGDWEAMAGVDVPPPESPERTLSEYWHGSGEFYKYDTAMKKTKPLATEDQITARRAYLACVRYVDRQVGKVLSSLEELGLAESTIVVVWGDHGWHLGDSAIWGKHSPLERALRSTLIIRAPGVSRAGLVADGVVETIDLYPTLVDLCAPRFTRTRFPLDGRTLRPMLTGEREAVRTAAVSYWGAAVSVRTATHRLVATRKGDDLSKVELYAVSDGPDPEASKNLAASRLDLVGRLLKEVPERAATPHRSAGFAQESAFLPRGLEEKDVLTIAATPRGVYAGTKGGAFRLDGDRWQPTDELPPARVPAITATPDGLLAVVGDALCELSAAGERRRIAPAPPGSVSDLETRSGVTMIATDRGLFRIRGGAAEPDAALARIAGNPFDIRSVAIGPSGAPAIAAASGLYEKRDDSWRRVLPRAGSRSWAPHDVRAVAYDVVDRLWFASPQGVGVRAESGWTLYDGRDGLPYADFTSIATGLDGAVWFGTRRGAIRWSGGDWAYRQSRRWLPGDDVRDVAIDSNGTIWFATAKGAGRISYSPTTLAEKADAYEEAIERYHRRTPYGYVDSATLSRPGDRSEWQNHDSDNDGLWTSMYGASQCFAYAATRDPAAKERARRAFEALRFLREVTRGGEHSPPEGFVARTIRPATGPDPNAGRAESDKKFRAERDRKWKLIEPRWPKSADGKWYWKSDTSSDELDGHYFFYPLYYDRVCETEAERAPVREVVRAITDHLIAHDFRLVDHDGLPTRWAQFGPRELNDDPTWWEERGLNSLSVLSYLAVAQHMTGDSKYGEAARELREKHSYTLNVLYPKNQNGPASGNQSDDEMAFMGYYNLIRYEPDPELRSVWTYSFHEYWTRERPERNPLFNFLYASVARGTKWEDAFNTIDLTARGDWLADSRDSLERFPLDLADWPMANSHRLDIALLPQFLRPGVKAKRGHRPDGKVLPVDERFFTHWNHDPWVLDTGGSGRRLADGATFLLPYYLGRYYGFVE